MKTNQKLLTIPNLSLKSRGAFSHSFEGGARGGFYFIFLSLVLCLLSTKTFAQTSLNTAGGEAIGAGGSLSFSVGQIVYTYNADATRTVAQGVQQPFENLLPLSVSLLNFTAKCNNNAINFSWCTLNEDNNAYFTLASSKDAINFIDIAKIKGNNTTINTNCYQFTLNNLNVSTNNLDVSTNYYRLSSTDTKGTTEYFKIITKNCNITTEFSFVAFPNPNNDIFTINANAEISYNIINNLGQSVDNGQITTKNINLSHVSKGIYYVIGQNNSKIITKKIIIE